MPDSSPSMVLVGLMSGTSLDGISAAVVRFRDENGRITSELLAYDVHAYTAAQRARLASALSGVSPDEYCRINFDLGEWLAAAAVNVMAASGVARADIAAIASHGQTIWHVPAHSTWQTGEAAVIAERTGRPVISDFRVRDVAAGGQGAPLVPIADATLFSSPERWRALQNLGGIGNVTIVPPAGDVTGVRAFDTGPGVVVIDGVTRLLEPALRFDRDGALARQGRSLDGVVEKALGDPYFAAAPPKSTGRELFDAAYIQHFVESCRAANPAATTADIVATAVHLTAQSIAESFRQFVLSPCGTPCLGSAPAIGVIEAIAAALAAARLGSRPVLRWGGQGGRLCPAGAFLISRLATWLARPGGTADTGKLTPA
jgi:anhydro-N-acetylmuramic acid kinase